MKKHFKKLWLIPMLVALFMLTNCQEEYEAASSHTNEGNATVIRKPFKNFKNLPSLIDETISRQQIMKSVDSTDIYDFKIDSSDVMEITTPAGKFYTMAITRDFAYQVDMFENLVICDRDSIKEAFIISYAPDAEYYQRLNHHPMAPFVGGICATRIDHRMLQKDGAMNCITVYYVYCNRDDPGGHLAHNDCYEQPGNLYLQGVKRCNTFLIGAPVFSPIRFNNSFVNLNGSTPSGGGNDVGPASPWDAPPDDNVLIGTNGPITGPINPDKEADEDNCNDLKNMSLNPKIKAKIQVLQTKTYQTREFGYSYSDNNDPVELPLVPGSPNLIKIKLGGTYYGASHTHPNQTTTSFAPMFSITDILSLAILKKRYFNPEEAITSDSKFVFTLTFQNYNSPGTQTFALKISNWGQFNDFVNSYTAMSPEMQYKIGYDLAQKYSKITKSDPDSGQKHLLTLLKYMESINLKGVAIYQATDEDLTGWEKQTYNPNDDNIKTTPCK